MERSPRSRQRRWWHEMFHPFVTARSGNARPVQGTVVTAYGEGALAEGE